MTDHSQSGEQALILEAVRRRGGLGLPGRLIEIGAYDPEIFSNSRALLSIGWSGVLVEPMPWHAERLRAFYSTRPDVEILQAAVASDAGVARMHATRDMTSTLSTAWRMGRAERGDLTAYEPEPLLVPLVTPDAILRAAGPFDVALIDAEGMSDEIAVALLAAGRRVSSMPWLVVVEPDSPKALEKLMRAFGFEPIGWTANNQLYAR